MEANVCLLVFTLPADVRCTRGASVMPVGGHRPVVTAGPACSDGRPGLGPAWGSPLALSAAELMLLTFVAVVAVAAVVVGVVAVASATISGAGLLAGWAPWPRPRRALHSPCCRRPLAGQRRGEAPLGRRQMVLVP